MNDTTTQFSRSEDAGIKQLPTGAKHIYSVGISTGGVAEIRMAEKLPDAHIVATTVDESGVAFAKDRIAAQHLENNIEAKIEDVAKPLPYSDGYFDYVYARLVLHYLTKSDLKFALSELYRVLRPAAKLFVVVRSTDCPDAKREGVTYDPETGGLTTCTVEEEEKKYSYTRYFHTEESIAAALKDAGFTVESVEAYSEQLFKDFMRTVLADKEDNVIQVVAVK